MMRAVRVVVASLDGYGRATGVFRRLLQSWWAASAQSKELFLFYIVVSVKHVAYVF